MLGGTAAAAAVVNKESPECKGVCRVRWNVGGTKIARGSLKMIGSPVFRMCYVRQAQSQGRLVKDTGYERVS
jgi:hypothetical protein